MIGASAIAAETFRRNFLAATDSFLDRRRCLVDDAQLTQEPIAAHLDRPPHQETQARSHLSEPATTKNCDQRTKNAKSKAINYPINQSTYQVAGLLSLYSYL
jgi:hypothetical protein